MGDNWSIMSCIWIGCLCHIAILHVNGSQILLCIAAAAASSRAINKQIDIHLQTLCKYLQIKSIEKDLHEWESNDDFKKKGERETQTNKQTSNQRHEQPIEHLLRSSAC